MIYSFEKAEKLARVKPVRIRRERGMVAKRMKVILDSGYKLIH